MKITFVLPFAGLAGGNRVVAVYAKKLTERGHDVTVVSQPLRALSARNKLRSLFKGQGWPKPEAKTPLLDFLGVRHIVLDAPRAVVDADIPNADAIIATWWETAEWVAELDKSKGERFYLLQDYEVFPYLPVQRVINTYFLPFRKIAVSGYIRHMLSKHHGVVNTSVIHNSVDIHQFNAPPRVKNKIFTVGFMYTSAPRKKIELALDVIKQIKQHKNLKVIAFGSKTPSGAHRLPDRVEYYERPDQTTIPKIYAQCDVWLFTSEAEGFGLPLLEAMACRTPVISTDAGAAPDLVDGQNGCIVATSAKSFIDKVEMFREMDSRTWLSYSQHAYDTSRSYSWDDATDLLEYELEKGCAKLR
jgi:glycosyltransferase involved in cell wall biosynthesis